MEEGSGMSRDFQFFEKQTFKCILKCSRDKTVQKADIKALQQGLL